MRKNKHFLYIKKKICLNLFKYKEKFIYYLVIFLCNILNNEMKFYAELVPKQNTLYDNYC